MIELDDIDRRIVAALQAEGRLPIVDLADRVGLSPTPSVSRPCTNSSQAWSLASALWRSTSSRHTAWSSSE